MTAEYATGCIVAGVIFALIFVGVRLVPSAERRRKPTYGSQAMS